MGWPCHFRPAVFYKNDFRNTRRLQQPLRRCFSTETLSCNIANAQHSSCRQCSALYLSDEPIEANRTRLTGDVYTARARGAEPLLAWRWKGRTADEGGANNATQPKSVSSCFTPLMVCTNCVETASLLNTFDTFTHVQSLHTSVSTWSVKLGVAGVDNT